MTDASVLENMASRLERLENECRELRRGRRQLRWAVAGLLAAACGWVFLCSIPSGTASAAPADGNKILQAQAFVVTDAEGAMRARLFLGNDGVPALQFFDEKGNRRLNLAVQDGDPGVAFSDAKGTNHLVIALEKNELPYIRFNDSRGKRRLLLNVENGKPGAFFYDVNGDVQTKLP